MPTIQVNIEGSFDLKTRDEHDFTAQFKDDMPIAIKEHIEGERTLPPHQLNRQVDALMQSISITQKSEIKSETPEVDGFSPSSNHFTTPGNEELHQEVDIKLDFSSPKQLESIGLSQSEWSTILLSIAQEAGFKKDNVRVDFGDGAINLMLKAERHTQNSINNYYTIIPKDDHGLLSLEQYGEINTLPTVDELRIVADGEFNLPVYRADPTGFINENNISVLVKDAASILADRVFSIKSSQKPNAISFPKYPEQKAGTGSTQKMTAHFDGVIQMLKENANHPQIKTAFENNVNKMNLGRSEQVVYLGNVVAFAKINSESAAVLPLYSGTSTQGVEKTDIQSIDDYITMVAGNMPEKSIQSTLAILSELPANHLNTVIGSYAKDKLTETPEFNKPKNN